MENHHAELILSAEDFRNLDWDKLLPPFKDLDYVKLCQIFSDAAKTPEMAMDSKAAKIFRLFADACSMRLSDEDSAQPFQPLFVVDGKRTPLPEDFSNNDLTFLSTVVEEIEEPLLQARIADLLWTAASKKNFKMALLAIDAHQKIPFREAINFQEDVTCLQRAIHLAKQLGPVARENLASIENKAFQKFQDSSVNDKYIPLKLARLLRIMDLGKSKEELIATKLKDLAAEFESRLEFLNARDYYQEAFSWYYRAEIFLNAWESIVSCAESSVKEAHRVVTPPNENFFVAARHFETAIHKLRSIPKTDRQHFSVDERLKELHREMSDAQQKSYNELTTIESPAIDVSELINKSKKNVKGKSLFEAILSFSKLPCDFNFRNLVSNSQKDLDSYIHTLIPADFITESGRVVARKPGRNVGAPIDDKENDANLRSQMILHYRIHVAVSVCGCIVPALQTLRLEHPLQLGHFMNFCIKSPVVPLGREIFFAKGLYAGYNNDFITALHLLVPQIENLLRSILKENGCKTTVLDSAGIETESGLSSLVDLPETEEIFGEKFTFELRSLFCDPFGANLRNEIAHGLLEENAFDCPEVIYAWWWIFRLIITGLFQQLLKEREQGAS